MKTTTLVVCAILSLSLASVGFGANKAPAKSEVKTEASKTPEKFQLTFKTTKGDVVLDCNRSWAPIGADRLYELVQEGFFKDIAFFRVVSGFVAQFGIHGDPKVSAKWREKDIKDDPVKETNAAGTLTFATAGKDTRTTQFFINLVDNKRLDGMGFAPVCKVSKGMENVKKFYAEYGEGAPMGSGPAQDMIQMEGNSYLKKNFSKLDYIKTATVKAL